MLPQTEWPHICPHILDVGEAICFGTILASVLPAQGIGAPGGPDRILFLVIDDNFILQFGLILIICRHGFFLSAPLALASAIKFEEGIRSPRTLKMM
jgi:hypothetical protein